jgi:predicted SnoaL-like aldol condensation-catalyzing enzyme
MGRNLDQCTYDFAGIDTVRFDDDSNVVEHWDVLRVIPETPKTGDGMV